MPQTAPQLPDEAVVVRGGKVVGLTLVKGCEHHEGVFGFSVQSAPDKTVAELAEAGKLPHHWLGVSSVRAIRTLGFDVVRTRGRGYHATVVVPEDLDSTSADRLAVLFELGLNPRQGA